MNNMAAFGSVSARSSAAVAASAAPFSASAASALATAAATGGRRPRARPVNQVKGN